MNNSSLTQVGLIISAPVFEDFFDHLGISRDEYLTSYDNDWICYYSRILARQGFRVTWYVFSRSVECPETHLHRPTGSEVRFVPASPLYNWWTVRIPYLRHFSYHLATISRALYGDLRDHPPDLLYVQDYESGRFDIISLMAARLGIPVVGQYQGGCSPARWPLRGLRRWAIRRAACLLAPNTEAYAVLRRTYDLPDDVAVYLPSPVQVPPLSPVPSSAVREFIGLRAKDRYMLFVGRLVNRHKGVDVLVSAFERIAARYPDLHLVIAGTGPDEDALKRQTASVPRVHFLGWVASRERVHEILCAAEVVACPSYEEAFCYVAAEAMAVGRPIVASAVGGLRDLVEEGATGYQVPPGDAAALEKALQALVENPDRAAGMGRAGRERIQRLFAEPVVAPRLAAILREAVTRPRIGSRTILIE